MNKISPYDVYNELDPHFPDEVVEDTGNMAEDLSQPLEVRKLYSMNFPEK